MWTRVGILLAVMLAFALDVYRLDGQSLWYDEGVSAFMVHRDVPAILDAAARDIHPPLYYLLLRLWAPFAGASEFALRFPSTLASVASVALLARLAGRLWGGGPALFAALFLAIAPFGVAYAQEARMYALVATLVLASFVCFERLLGSEDSPGHPLVSHPLTPKAVGRPQAPPEGAEPPLDSPIATTDTSQDRARWRWWVAYVVITLAALHTQYFAALALVAQNGATLLGFGSPAGRDGRRRRWGWWRRWLAAQAVVVVLYLPWLAYARGSLLAWPALNEPLSPLELGRRLFLVFAFGPAWDATATSRAILAVGILAMLGPVGWAWAPTGRRRHAALMGSALFLGVLASFYLITLQRPAYNPKFLLLAEPGFALLLASGLTAAVGIVRLALGWLGGRTLATAAGGVVALLGLGAAAYPSARALDAYYHDSRYARDDYRSLVAYVEALQRPSDLIVLNAPGQAEIFGYYYHGGARVLPLPADRPADRHATEAALASATTNARAVWAVQWATDQSDPDGIVSGWLGQHLAPAGGRWFGSVYLALYASFAGAADDGRVLAFAEGVGAVVRRLSQLLAYGPGDYVGLVLQWPTAAARPLSVFVHLIDDDGYPWGQHDAALPMQGDEDRHAIFVPPGTPPGRYALIVGLYDAASGQRLPLADGGDSARLATVMVERSASLPPVVFFPQERRQDPVGPLRLLGFDLSKAGEEQRRHVFRQGETAELTLYWQATTRGAQVPVALGETAPEVVLRGEGGETIAFMPSPPIRRYPPSVWTEGELVRDPRRWTVAAPSGPYRLQVRWSAGGAVADLGAIVIEAP